MKYLSLYSNFFELVHTTSVQVPFSPSIHEHAGVLTADVTSINQTPLGAKGATSRVAKRRNLRSRAGVYMQDGKEAVVHEQVKYTIKVQELACTSKEGVDVRKLAVEKGTSEKMKKWVKNFAHRMSTTKEDILSKTPWVQDKSWNGDFMQKDVLPVFVTGKFINAKMVHRLCRYVVSLSGNKNIYVEDPHAVALATTNSWPPPQDYEFAVNHNRIKDMKVKWGDVVHAGKIVFIPISYPYGVQWNCAVLWRGKTKKLRVRVFNPWPASDERDLPIAHTLIKVFHAMDPTCTSEEWEFCPPHDVSGIRESDKRCGLFVTARAWQVASLQGLTHRMNPGVLRAVTYWVQVQLLKRNRILCGEDDEE